ncbi:MAG: DNA polymerase I [Chloroflexaceae bacterium]|nr:DNA polymerase I [Chloroflexaceae bacterium]
MNRTKQLVVIDGHALAFRAFHALSGSNLRTSQGEPTYAVFGFAQLLLTMLRDEQPDYAAIAFDIGRTFRHDLYADYKAGRAPTPPEFPPQLERIKQLVDALNMPIYTAENYEADDVIGTLARQASAQSIHTLILTSDTDTLQLVNEHVQVVLANPYGRQTTTTRYDEAHVRERYHGLQPYQLTDLRGLKGDTSDNIPGVKGIGETGAIKLLSEFGTVEALYERLEHVPTRYRKHLAGQQQQALFSKQLATIVCDVPIELDLEHARVGVYERTAAVQLLRELEFSSLLNKLPPEINPTPVADPLALTVATGAQQQHMFADTPVAVAHAAAPGSYRSVTTSAELERMIAAMAAAPAFAFDTELSGLRPWQDDLVGISLAVEPGNAWYIPVGHVQGEQLDRAVVLDALRPLFANAQKPKYAHHARFDIEVLLQAGVETHGLAFDTMIAAALLGKRAALKELAFTELQLDEPLTEITDLIGRGAKQVSFAQVDLERATAYAAADADITLRLAAHLSQQLAAEEQLQAIFQSIEMPLVPILVAMERAGIGFDTAVMRELRRDMSQRLAQVEQQIYDLAGERFNINSGIQLGHILFDVLGLPTEGLNKTSTGRFSLTADALERLSDSHSIVQHILEYRQFSKLMSTYIDALPTLINPATGRIHTSFHQMGAATGRLASSDPNLQNIPVRTEEGRAIRRAFVAAPGCHLLSADYSQIELRILAHITEDANLIQAFLDGQDIHAATAAQLFGIAPHEVTKDQRRVAKSTVFGVIYGISSFGLARRTDLSRSEASNLIDAFFARFPGVRRYIDTTLDEGRRRGYVESLSGRRRAMPDLQARGARRQAAEREAINMPIQATAADMMKLAMIRVAHALQQANLQTRMLLQVHDELIFEVPAAERATVAQLVRHEMERVSQLRVPLKVDMEMGLNWGELSPIEDLSPGETVE